MSNTPPEAAPSLRTQITPYMAGWAVLAIGALGYIGWIATHPERTARSDAVQPATPAESNQGQRANSDALADIKALKDSVGEVHRDLAQLKSDMSSVIERNSELATRVSTLEEKPAKIAGGPIIVNAPPAGASAAKPAEPRVISVAPTTPAQPATADASKKALETGSVGPGVASHSPAPTAGSAQSPVVFGPATVKTPKPVGIQIATGPSIDSIRLSWSILSERHRDMLGTLEPRVFALNNADGSTYNLVAGPMKSSAEAKKVCAALQAEAVACRVGDYKGDAF